MSAQEDSRGWSDIAETVLTALRRSIGPNTGYLEANRFSQSAIRTAWRRYGKESLEAMTAEDLINLLVTIGWNKYVSALRHEIVGDKHKSKVAEYLTNARIATEPASQLIAAEEIDRLLSELDPKEAIVVKGVLSEKKGAEIADEIHKTLNKPCTQQRVSSIWRRLCQRLLEQSEPPTEMYR